MKYGIALEAKQEKTTRVSLKQPSGLLWFFQHASYPEG